MDLIDRQTAIDALGIRNPISDSWTDEYELGTYKQWEQDRKAISEVPSAEPEKPYVIKMHRLIKADERERLEKELYRKLSQQSPILLDSDMELVYPVRMKGKWNKIHWKAYRCSECERVSEYQSNFCPNCGADMRPDDN